MSEANAGLRALELHEREDWHRARAQRELVGAVVDADRTRTRLWRRTVRRAA